MVADPIIAEALRVYARYATEVVEGLNLCPWAARARSDGHVAVRVLPRPDDDVGPSMHVIERLEQEPHTEIGILLYPRLALGRHEFERFVARLRESNTAQHDVGKAPFAMAAFHPDARPDRSDPERLIPFLRRTPDPTVQLVRVSVLERVREKSPSGTSFLDLSTADAVKLLSEPAPVPLREKIAIANQATVEEHGIDVVERLLTELKADRDEAYARIASSWSGDPTHRTAGEAG